MSQPNLVENAIDSLTQMPNRAGWTELAQHALQANQQAKVVLFIDLDRFKWVNDSLGHDAGDELLQKVANIIKTVLDSEDICGRMGGDEFVALLQSERSVKQADKIANELVNQLSQPITLSRAEVEIGASIGVSSFPQDGSSLPELLKFSDLAMYRAKHSGRNQVVAYQPEMIRQIEYRRGVQFALRQALKDELLSLCFQPIYNYRTQQVFAIEVILNAEQSQTLYSMEQSEIFSIADESQVSVQLSEWMIEQSLEFVKGLEDSELPLSIVIPVRPSHFHQKTFVDWLSEKIEQYEVSAEQVVLSLNETCLNAQRFPVEKQLKSLAKVGVEIAAQNFGAGNLSPLRLHDWPITQLYLSSLFVSEITNKRSMEAMAMALIQMGQTLNKKMVAYGVRTPEQQAFLLSQHCDLMQGPIFGEPISAAEVELQFMKGMRNAFTDDQYLDEFLEEY